MKWGLNEFRGQSELPLEASSKVFRFGGGGDSLVVAGREPTFPEGLLWNFTKDLKKVNE